MRSLLLGTLFAGAALSAPLGHETHRTSADIGVQLDPSGGLPLLQLPYGTWRANSYDKENDVWMDRHVEKCN